MKKGLNKRMIIMLAIVGVIFGGVFGFEIFRGMMIKKYMASMGGQPQTVSTTKAVTQEWNAQLEAVGTLRAAQGVDIANELAGVIEEIHFNSGDKVKAGTLLVKLRAADDLARLRTLQAAAKLAAIVLERDIKQFKVQAVSQSVLDTDAASLSTANAQVAEQQAIVDKKFIRAPFSGNLGIRNADAGQYINAGTPIVSLQQLDTIYLDFFVPQQTLNQLKTGTELLVKNDSYPGKTFPGEIVALNSKIDTATRNIQVRAELPNADHALLPGMYATAAIETGTPQHYVTLPQTAITYNPYGNTVFLVDESKNDKGEPLLKARQSFVTTGATRGDQVAILSGVKEGEVVVTSGQMKLQNGSPLIVNNTVIPSNDAAPKLIKQ
jgi:membrane fusion protein (multidrug efflux system)